MSLTQTLSAAVRTSSEGPDVTWIGPNPFGIGLCLGFDNGTIIFSVTATGYTTRPQDISPAKEAINGVAAIGTRSLAVSTRSDVTFIQIESPINNSRAIFPGGAHGVVATQSGYFIAPLGAKGLLLARPTTGPHQMMHLTTGTEGRLYFYRMTALHDATGKETLVFANRRNGVGLSEFKGEEGGRNVHTLSFEGLDEDTSTQDDPVAMRLNGIAGQVYRVLATPQHLFVLSSKALYVWTDLVGKLLHNKTATPKSHPLVVPLEAVDMCLYNEYILLIMAANSIMNLKISDLEKQPYDQLAAAPLPATSIEMSLLFWPQS